ncbi:rCG62424 [Rattus norvegicus]|uniref:RCG62424 n=1 Tax=Rattus norvegicus TaxID=10116 RepID=A6HBP2_RAT|nr:rCG62424 [Rattus norvegicus]
MLLHLYVK